LIAWLIVGLSSLGEISSALGAGVSALVVDVSQVGDGSVEQAVLEAQRQAVGWGPAYRSSNKDEHTIFSGKFIPPELTEEKKGQYAYGLAVLSDDGCNVKVGESIIHQRVGQRQHLPSLGESFHELQVILAPGESVDLQVEYSNVIYDDDPKSPGYPDIDGCSLFLYLIPMGIAVDANRDGTIPFSGENRDSTSEQAPFRFWCNDDFDSQDADYPDASSKNTQDQKINCKRDLEDYARLHVNIGGLQEAIAGGPIQVGFEWRNVMGNPSIKICQAAEPDGGQEYITGGAPQGNENWANSQIFLPYATLYPIHSSGGFKFPASFWQASSYGLSAFSAAHPNRYLLFDGITEGKGKLVLTFWKDGRRSPKAEVAGSK
jgi:hypothetical protein